MPPVCARTVPSGAINAQRAPGPGAPDRPGMPGMPGGPVGPTRPNSPSETALSLALQAVSRRTSTPDFFLQQTAALAAEPTVTTPATTSTLIPLRHITPHLLMGMNPPSGRPRGRMPPRSQYRTDAAAA